MFDLEFYNWFMLIVLAIYVCDFKLMENVGEEYVFSFFINGMNLVFQTMQLIIQFLVLAQSVSKMLVRIYVLIVLAITCLFLLLLHLHLLW